ncbi:MAG: hypothetical protein R8P61_34475 [Bacteroidia bacterium]|nr:hypothetical protein [Bacteroidia bacterium]
MKYMLLCFLLLVCQAPLRGQGNQHKFEKQCLLSQDPVKGKKSKPAAKTCKPVKPLAKNKSKTSRKTSRKRGNMGNSGGRGNMYFARNNP